MITYFGHVCDQGLWLRPRYLAGHSQSWGTYNRYFIFELASKELGRRNSAEHLMFELTYKIMNLDSILTKYSK
jgi:hypothetical protein